MAIPLIPFAGLALNALNALSLAAIAGLLLDRTFDNDDPVDSPVPNQPPFTPPFVGGQCTGNPLRGYMFFITRFYNPNTEVEYTNSNPVPFGNGMVQIPAGSRVLSVVVEDTGVFQRWRITHSTGSVTSDGFGGANTSGDIPITDFGIKLILYDYGTNAEVPDNCGNLPNPNPSIPPSIDGGKLLPIPNEDPGIVYAGAIVPTLGGILAALAAIANAIGAIGNVLDGIRAIGDAIGKIREWLEEKEKEKPKNRTIWAGRWSSMEIEGGTDLITQLIDGQVLSPYQIQVEIERFPITCSRKVGVNSPSFAHLEPLGYLFPRSANGGYSEVIPLRFLRNSASINEDTRGLSWSFRENPLVKARFRVWYSSAPTSI